MKKALYHSIAGRIAERTPVTADDVMIMLTEIPGENWSLGQGIAQMA